MDQNRFEELKEAYALNSLSEEERQEFERYLSENPSERAEVDELSSIAALLALAPQEEEPPAKLRRDLMSRVRSEASGDGAVADAGRGASRTGRASGARGGWIQRLFGARGIATAAAAALLIGLAVWNISLQSEVRDLRDFQMSSYKLQSSGEAEAAQGQVVKIGDQGAMLVAADLPKLPADKTYEMWSIKDKTPRPCGLFEAGSGVAIEGIDGPISGAEQFAVTVEPKGGSDQPTTEPIAVADLTSGA
jgi:anti-sigma-K factor RskA